MLRRFGWPNSGSDDYKNLCSWTITTPIKGLYLCVTPYLGDGNYHFAFRFNKIVDRLLNTDPGREAFFKRWEHAVRKWWYKRGCKSYVFGRGKKEGDPDKLVKAYAEQDGWIFGLWEKRDKNLKSPLPKKWGDILWWLGQFIEEIDPRVRLPRMSKRGREKRLTRFQLRAKFAVMASMRDLLSPTHVRDISFTPFGDIERSPEAIKRYSNQKDTGYFEGAGHTPRYWYRHAKPYIRRKKKSNRPAAR